MEQDGDPYAVMVPTAEIGRFCYGPSTRLAQALFWAEYDGAFNADRSDVFQEGAVKMQLRHWFERCSAPFTFDRVIVDRDNNSTLGKNVENENLMSALTNSLSFANSEFTFSSNLRLNATIEVKAV